MALSDDLFRDQEDVLSFAMELPQEFLDCRRFLHSWIPHTAKVNRDGTIFEEVICHRCKTIRAQELTPRGYVFRTKYSYPDGYLSSGIGRMDRDGRGVLRIASVYRTAGMTIRTRRRGGR